MDQRQVLCPIRPASLGDTVKLRVRRSDVQASGLPEKVGQSML